MQHIHHVLNTLRQHKLYVNIEKCSFGIERVQYLGYIVDEHGVHVDLSNIQPIHGWSNPMTLTEIHKFLGLANFYGIFLMGFSNIS